MKLLVEAGLATERHFDDGITRYEIEQEHHDHLVCVKCGKIQEFECEHDRETQHEIASATDSRSCAIATSSTATVARVSRPEPELFRVQGVSAPAVPSAGRLTGSV